MRNHGRMLSAALCPCSTCEEHMQLCFLQREVGIAKEDDILWFPTSLMWDPSTCTCSSHREKDQHRYICMESCETHHGLHRVELLPHFGIVEVPSCITLKMQCGIAILVKFIVWSIITCDSDSYSCVLSI